MNIEDFPDFEREAIEERLAHERRVKKDFGKVSVIMRRFFTSKEQRLILKSVFRKRGEDKKKYWEYTRDKRLKSLLDIYCHFFLKEDYKTIDYECKKRLTEKQYNCLRAYIRWRSIRRAANQINCREDYFLIDFAYMQSQLNVMVKNDSNMFLPLIILLGEIREWTYDREKKRS
jgi:hypothetical protein